MKRSLITAATIALTFLIPFITRAASDPATPQPLGTLIDIGGHRIHLYCTGSGSPTVMVVGAAFSFDWGLVQPEVAKFTRVCTYDPSGSAWSDPPSSGIAPDCAAKVSEIHSLLQHAAIPGPYVLVGYSYGGLIARLYAHRYPEEVSGLVVVDHAFLDVDSNVDAGSKAKPLAPTRSADSPPELIFSVPITIDLADDLNFRKLPPRNQELHKWALSIHSLLPTPEAAAECSAAVETGTLNQSFPLGGKPLVIIRTNNNAPAYERLQTKLLSLSQNSKQLLAENSTHMVIIDEPDVVTNGIGEVIEAVRKNTKLTATSRSQ